MKFHEWCGVAWQGLFPGLRFKGWSQSGHFVACSSAHRTAMTATLRKSLDLLLSTLTGWLRSTAESRIDSHHPASRGRSFLEFILILYISLWPALCIRLELLQSSYRSKHGCGVQAPPRKSLAANQQVDATRGIHFQSCKSKYTFFWWLGLKLGGTADGSRTSFRRKRDFEFVQTSKVSNRAIIVYCVLSHEMSKGLPDQNLKLGSQPVEVKYPYSNQCNHP